MSNFRAADRPCSNGMGFKPRYDSADTSDMIRRRQRMLNFSTDKIKMFKAPHAKDTPEDERDHGSDST